MIRNTKLTQTHINRRAHTRGRPFAVVLVALIFALLLPTLSACADPVDAFVPTVRVMVAYGEGITLTSNNPMRVRRGEDATFDISVADGYKISVPDGVFYSDGVLTVPDAVRPMTVTLLSRTLEEYSFAVFDGITSSVDDGTLREDTVITLSAPEAKDGRVFIGYSDGGTLAAGGRMITFIREYTFPLTENLALYPNYADKDSKILVYKANGGSVKGGGEVVYTEIKNSAYICPNAMINDGTLTREGYVLGGYNTASDGSGRYYGCGWNVVMPETGVETLYAVWYPVSNPDDFEYTKSASGLTVRSYSGNDEFVVIPETVGGVKVIGVTGNAFLSNKTVKSVFIPRFVTTVAQSAFKSCSELTTLYLSDSALQIYNDTFVLCPNLQTLYMQAVTAPRYMTSRNGNYQVKYERLMTAESPKIVVTGGSNVAYGVDSALMEEQLGGGYSLVNYGCNQGTPAVFYIEVISAWMHEGDILLHAPEGFSSYQFGYNEINTTTWQIFEGAYDAFACVDIRHFVKLFSSFASFNNSRMSRSAQTYERYSTETVNYYGDYIKLKKGQNYSPSLNSRSYEVSTVVSNYSKLLNDAVALCQAKGAKAYLTFGVVNSDSLKPPSRTSAVQKAYRDAIVETYCFDAVISEVSTYVMASKYFYNSDFHLGTEGSQIRTRNLAADLLAQFEAEKTK